MYSFLPLLAQIISKCLPSEAAFVSLKPQISADWPFDRLIHPTSSSLPANSWRPSTRTNHILTLSSPPHLYLAQQPSLLGRHCPCVDLYMLKKDAHTMSFMCVCDVSFDFTFKSAFKAPSCPLITKYKKFDDAKRFERDDINIYGDRSL